MSKAAQRRVSAQALKRKANPPTPATPLQRAKEAELKRYTARLTRG